MSLSFHLGDDPLKFISFVFIMRSLVIMNETHMHLQNVAEIPEQYASWVVCLIVRSIGITFCYFV